MSSRGRDTKACIYYYARRGWHEQLVSFCDEIMTQKGKDPVTVFWKAYGLGKTQGLERVQRELEVFQNRRDLQLPLTTALLYFARCQGQDGTYDSEYVRGLEAELSVAEEMAKDAGIVMTARFCLFVNDFQRASILSQKILQQCNGSPSTPFEIEAQTIDGWAAFAEACHQLKESSSADLDEISTTVYRKLQAVDDLVKGRGEQFDVDTLMLHANIKSIIGSAALNRHNEVVSIFNQIIAMQPQFAPVLAEKSVLLASIGEWDHALEFAQRALDVDKDYYDALVVIAVHAFTQESDPRDAARKLEDVYHAFVSKEPSSYTLAIEASSLFSSICARQPQALQTCANFLQHTQRLNMLDDAARASVLCSLGNLYLMQGVGGYDTAMKSFKDASKIDAQCVKALEGMISCQLSEGLHDDAEAQIELVSVMHSAEELSAEFHYLKAILAKHKAKMTATAQSSLDSQEHVFHLNECRKIISRDNTPPFVRYSGQSPFYHLVAANPDFLLRIAVDYMEYSDGDGFLSFSLFNSTSDENNHDVAVTPANNTVNVQNTDFAKRSTATTTFATTHHASSRNDRAIASSSSSPSSSSSIGGKNIGGITSGTYDTEMSPNATRGLEILNKLVATCPGMTCLYVEISRCFSAHRMFSDAIRVLNQCLVLQPHCAAAMVALALVEIRQQRPVNAQSILEQALSCDFSVRSVTVFRLAQAIVSAQRGNIDDSLSTLDDLLALPDIRSNNPVDAAGLSNGGIGTNEVPSQRQSSTGDYTDSFRLTNDDRVAAFIIHASLLSRLRRQKEANKVLSEAKILFAGMTQETQILIASSQLAIERKDFDSAIRRLDKVEANSPSYPKAQMLKAEILLKGNRDREGYTRCFSNLIEKDPSAKNYALLADAYLRILSPEAAIDALEVAYSKDPSNSRLRVRIGRALTATHEYHRAVKFYESAIHESRENTAGSNNEMVGLSLDSAKLYVKLGRIKDALHVLEAALHVDSDAKDITDLQHDVTTLLLLSDVQLHEIADLQATSTWNMTGVYGSNGRTYTVDEKEKMSLALKWLASAHEIQKRVVDMSRTNLSGVAKANGQTMLGIEKTVLSDICCKEATLSYIRGSEANVSDSSVHLLLEESLSLNPENVRAMIFVASGNLKNGEAAKCRSQCEKCLQAAASIEEEAWTRILLSEALYLQSTQHQVNDLQRFEASRASVKPEGDDTEDFIEDFKSPDMSESKHDDQLLHKASDAKSDSTDGQLTAQEVLKPLEDFLSKQRCHYRALEKMISLSRRLGLLNHIPRYLEAARQSDGRAEVHPGYRYCKGLYARYTNDIGASIVEFNAARGDDQWGCAALIAMIDLYLNPDQDYSSLAWDDRESGPLDDISANNLSAADSLLQELKVRSSNDREVKVLENYCLLATRNKSNVQHVLESFIEVLETDHDYLPAILGLATAYMVDKEQHKAKNLLKRITKLTPHKHDGEDFSKAHFLIARMNIDKGRFDVAQDAIKKILAQNRSSPGAWELMGLVMEKAQDYVKAAECYEKAWTLNFQANAPVGFKLAYCYMKAGVYIQSIDVCETVLDRFPQYPRIKEEILDTCVSSLAEG